MLDAVDRYDDHISRGIALRSRRDWSGAVREFNAACQLQPQALGARCELAFTHLESGNWDDARAWYRSVENADPQHADALCGLAQVNAQRGDLAQALGYLRRAVSAAPQRLSIPCDLAALLRKMDRPTEARDVLQGVLKIDPTHAAALVGLGLLARQRNDHVGAAAFFRQALSHAPQQAAIRLELAMSLRQAGLAEAAAAEYHRVLDADATNRDATAGLAAVLRSLGRARAALEYLQRMVEHMPDDTPSRLELGATLRDLGRLDAAAAEYRCVHAAHPQEWAAFVGLALVERQRGAHAVSLEHIDAALSLEPQHTGLQAERALTLRLLGRYDEAEAWYRQTAATQPQSAAPLQGLSLIALARGDLDAALEFAQRAAQLDTESLHSSLLLAALYRDSGRLPEAAAVIDQVLAAAPKAAGAWLERGLLCRLDGRHDAALAAFERVAALGDTRGVIEAAVEHVALDHPERAVALYGGVPEEDPAYFAAQIGLAELAMLGARYEECIRRCDGLIHAQPIRVAPYRLKCRALIQIDRADEAERIARDLERVVQDPAEADAVQLEVLRTCGRRAAALTLLEQPRIATSRAFPVWLEALLARLAFFDLDGARAALENPPAIRPFERARTAFARGMLADLEWRIEDAIEAFEAALALHADDAEAHHHLARLYYLKANTEAAGRHLATMAQKTRAGRALRGEPVQASQTLIGHLLNELRLDRGLAERLTEAQRQELPRRIPSLAALVQSDPRQTAAAACLLLALRQSGAFELPTDHPDRATHHAIPRRIMQYWDEKVAPEPIVRLMRSWVEAHPGYAYTRFDDASAQAYLKSHHHQDVLEAYRRARHPAQRSDLFRLAYLSREGGYYIDADDRCDGHLGSITPADAVFVGYQEQYGTLGNNFLGCVPGESVVERALELCTETLNRGDAETIWLATGPGLLTRVFAEAFVETGGEGWEWRRRRRILQRSELSKLSWPHVVFGYKATRRGWLKIAR